MNRVMLAAFALLAVHGCAAVDQTTTVGEERRLMGTTMDDADMTTSAATMMGTMADPESEATTPMGDTGHDVDVTSAAVRSGGIGKMLLALLTFLYVSSAAGAALDESTTMADERRLMGTSTMMGEDDMMMSTTMMMGTTAGMGGGGTTMMVGTTMGMDTGGTTMDDDSATTTMMGGNSDGGGDSTSGAFRVAFPAAPVLGLAAALGLAARR